MHINRLRTCVVTATAAAMLVISAPTSHKGHEPLVEPEKNAYSVSQADRNVFFLPFYNGTQPNRLSVAPTKRTREFLAAIKKSNPKTDWSDSEKVFALLTKIISDVHRQCSKEEYAGWYYKKVTLDPDCFFDCKGIMCAEKSVMLASLLTCLGYEIRLMILMPEDEKPGENERHMVVVARDPKTGKSAVLDPSLGKVENDGMGGYALFFIREISDLGECRIKMYVLEPFSPEKHGSIAASYLEEEKLTGR